MTPEAKPLPCPWCEPPRFYGGYLPVLVSHSSYRCGSQSWVECQNCGMVGPTAKGTNKEAQARALAAWNTRSSSARVVADLEKRVEAWKELAMATQAWWDACNEADEAENAFRNPDEEAVNEAKARWRTASGAIADIGGVK